VTGARTTFTLYSKPGCHLCEDVRAVLDELQPARDYFIDEIDITADAALFARYRFDIPVLLKNGVEVARGRIGERELVELIDG